MFGNPQTLYLTLIDTKARGLLIGMIIVNYCTFIGHKKDLFKLHKIKYIYLKVCNVKYFLLKIHAFSI